MFYFVATSEVNDTTQVFTSHNFFRDGSSYLEGEMTD